MAFKIKGSIAVVKDVTAGGNLQTGTSGLLKLTDSGGTNTVSLQAPTTVGSSYTLRLPTADGTSGYSLTTNGAGQLQFSNVSGGGGGGTVTSVGLTADPVFTIGGSPVTGSGTLTIGFAGSQTANRVLASPDGTTGAVSLRALTATDIPALPESKITNLVTDLSAKLNLAGGTMTGALTLFADPVSPLHAATKQYVDAFAVGLDFKASVRIATTANITLAGNQTIDGVVTNTNDRVLVKNQSSALQNGIYVAAGGAWSRATDADSSSEVTSGMYTFVEEGTVNGDSAWVLTTNNPITLDTTALTFVQFTGTGQISPGTGITITGNQIAINTSVVPTSSNNLSFFATTSSAQLAALLSDKTGTGVNVFATSPTLVTPNIGAATATSVNGLSITSSTGTLTIANGKTLTNNNTLTFTGTDSSSVAFGTGGTVLYTSNTLAAHAATTSAQLASVISDETGSGALVFGTSPSLTTPAIGSGGFTIAGSSSGITTINTSATASGTVTIPAGTDTLVNLSGTQTLTNKTLTSPTLTTPVLGTPSSGTLTNCTGLPVATGISGLGTGVATFLATPSSANLISAVTDETGTGSLVFATSPTLAGTPLAPTAAAGTNTTQIATTAFVTSANTKYSSTFDATTSWGAAAGGLYTITITAGTHGKGTSPDVRIEEGSGADWIRVLVDQEIVRSTGNVEIKVSDSPDGRFAGRMLIY